MPHERQRFGTESERLAEEFLKGKGWTILDRHYTNRYGELDLVAQDGHEVVFVEVKARRTSEFGYPEESVTAQKIRKIALAANAYLQRHKLVAQPFRVDVIAIEWTVAPPRITHFEAVG